MTKPIEPTEPHWSSLNGSLRFTKRFRALRTFKNRFSPRTHYIINRGWVASLFLDSRTSLSSAFELFVTLLLTYFGKFVFFNFWIPLDPRVVSSTRCTRISPCKCPQNGRPSALRSTLGRLHVPEFCEGRLANSWLCRTTRRSMEPIRRTPGEQFDFVSTRSTNARATETLPIVNR